MDDFGYLVGGRALQLQARGDDRAALDHLVVLLAVSRNLRNHAAVPSYWPGMNMERRALDALGQWLIRLGRKPDLARRALEALHRHEASLPPATDALKGEYLRLRNSLESPYFIARSLDGGSEQALSRGIGELVILAGGMPWEKARRRRIVDAAYAGYFRFAQADYPVMVAQRVAEQEAR